MSKEKKEAKAVVNEATLAKVGKWETSGQQRVRERLKK